MAAREGGFPVVRRVTRGPSRREERAMKPCLVLAGLAIAWLAVGAHAEPAGQVSERAFVAQ